MIESLGKAVYGLAIIAIFGILAGVAHAETKWVSDPIQIGHILHSIPALGGDLDGRLTSAGLQVKMIGFATVSKEDVIGDPQRLAVDDIEIRVVTNGEPRSGDCKIMGSPTFIKRRGRYLPQDRTGVWLLTGRCMLPN